MSERIVTTQGELDRALADGIDEVYIESPAGVWLGLRDARESWVGVRGSATVRASGSATVHAWDSATVHAWGSATVHASGSATVRASGSATVHAWGSATVHASGSATVHAWDSATVRASGSATVHAWDSATVHAWGSATVHASGSATVHASGSATVHASSYVAVHLHSTHATVTGGHVIDVTALDLTDLDTWIGYTGCATDGDDLVLYKALDADLRAEHGNFQYPGPGGTVEAPDWTETNACGGGLHLSPRPEQATDYRSDAARWLECRVAREDFRPIPGGTPKGKSRRVRVVAEVDGSGRALAVAP